MSNPSNIKEITPEDLPKNIIPTAGMKIRAQYEQDLKDGKINKDGTPKNGPAQQDKTAKTKEQKEQIKDTIKEYLATKEKYNVMVNGQIKEFSRKTLNPKEHFLLHDITRMYNKIVNEVQAIDRRRLLLAARATILGRSLTTDENLKAYDEVIQQIEALTERIDRMSWEFDGKTFYSESEYATYLYSMICKLCLNMTDEEFNNSAFRSSPNLAKASDVYGTRHIADACLEVEMQSYAYFQSPSESSLES